MESAAARTSMPSGEPRSEDPDLERRLDQGVCWTAHELRGPLLGVRAALEVIAREPDPDPRRVEILRRVLCEVERLAATAEAVLGWAAGTRQLEPRETDITLLVQEAVESCRLAGADGFELTGCPPASAIAPVDPVHVRAAIANLLRNASAYAAPGTTVEVDVAAEGAQIAVSVRNRGPVIPARDLERIFDPFVRSSSAASQTGTGLGLFITRKVAEAHGGRISVVSEDSDTTFRLTLPASVLARAS